MAFRRARSIDRLHEIVADHDLVLTSDAPLALALNRRADQARLGDVAATPRNVAKQGLEVADRRDVFHEIVRRTELSFKQAARNLDLALRCWEDTGRSDAILEHDRHDRPEMRAVLDVLESLETAYSLREDVTIPDSVDLAVIAPDRLSALDRSVLPDSDSYEAVDPFHDRGTFDPGEIDLLPSTVSIAETIEAHLEPENAGDVGIVLDPSGPIRPMIEATLDARSIPYHTEEQLGEHPGLRSLLRTLRLGLSRTRLRARDVRGLLVDLGLPLDRRDEARFVDRIDDASLAQITELWDELPGLTLGEALAGFRSFAKAPRELDELVDQLGVADEPVTPELLNALDFYLDTYRVERDYSREGVLLASGRDNAYVDRPLVFYLGLGTEWAASPPNEAWIGPDERTRREQRDIARFERLLQNGRRRVYLAQDTRRGQPVTPCFHLHELLDDEFDRFAELPHRRRRPPDPEPPDPAGFEHDPELVDPDVTDAKTLSSRAVDQLTYCPRDWFADQLVPEPDQVWFRRGQLFHDFAELAVHHPETTDPTSEDFDRLVEVALDELADLVDPDDLEAQRTELAVGFRTLARWLEANPPAEEPVEGYTDPPERRRSENRLAQALDLELDRQRTERWFATTPLGVHGKVDLVHAAHRLVDWKSTRNPASLNRTVRDARLPVDEGPPSVQPAVYLLHHRSLAPTEELEFTFVDLLAERNEAIRGDTDPDDVERRLTYFPGTRADHVASRAAYRYITETSKKRKDVFEAIGYPAYRSYVTNADVPPLEDKAQAAQSGFADGLARLACDKRGDLKKSEQAARGAVKKLVALQRRTLYADDLDRLADHVDTLLDDLADWRRSRFPVPDDVDMDEVDHRDLILTSLDTHRPARGEAP